MHVVFKQIRNINIPIDLQVYLFDHVILPIALFGCGIRGFEKSQIIINVHNDFLRQIINLRKSTPIYICYMQNWNDTQYKLISNLEWKRIQIIKITVLNNALRTRKGVL